MPQRSNAFQRLAFLVHKSLAPEWLVTESDMLVDLHTGTLREVDITAKRLVAAHQLVFSIECRDHRRAADVSWVEQMHTKHQLLLTSKLALWSRSGFTREAVSKAKLLKIDTVSQAQSVQPKWAGLARQLADGSVQLVTPTLSPFVDVRLPSGELQRFEGVASWQFYDSNGKVVGSIPALLHEILHHEVLRTTFLDHAPLGESDFYVELVPPSEWFVDVPGSGRGIANRIGVGVRTLGERARLSTISASRGDRVMTLAVAPLRNGRFEAVFEESESGEIRSQVNVWRSDA